MQWLAEKCLIAEIPYGLNLLIRGHIINASNWPPTPEMDEDRQKLV